MLLQNEISNGNHLIRYAKEQGMKAYLNPSLISKELLQWPLEYADQFMMNPVSYQNWMK